MNRDTVADWESGKRNPQKDTKDKILGALDAAEREVGLQGVPIADLRPVVPHLVTFKIQGNFGVNVVVEGPVDDLPELEQAVARLLGQMGKDEAQGD